MFQYSRIKICIMITIFVLFTLLISFSAEFGSFLLSSSPKYSTFEGSGITIIVESESVSHSHPSPLYTSLKNMSLVCEAYIVGENLIFSIIKYRNTCTNIQLADYNIFLHVFIEHRKLSFIDYR